MSYRSLTFYLLSAAAILGILRLIQRPQGITGLAIANSLRARFLSELSLLIASFLVYFLWIRLAGDSVYSIVGGLLLAHAAGMAAWWIVRRLYAPPPPPAPL